MKNTAIEWAHHTFNPWIGCTKVSPACDHCYAENLMASRMHVVQWGAGQPRKRTSARNWNDPLRWNAEAERLGVRYRVFCASLADVFDNEVPVQWRISLMRLICDTPQLDWLLLTKRIGNAAGMLESAFRAVHHQREGWADNVRPNVWIGATICNQAEADRDIPKLLATPARVRFLSIEPLLGPVKLSACWLRLRCGFGDDEDRAMSHCFGCGGLSGYSERCAWPSQKIDWVIVGGESGAHARPMHPDWVRSLRDQCVAGGVPFLFKQWGEWSPEDAGESAHADTVGILPSGDCAYYSQGYVAPFDSAERLGAGGDVRLDGRTLMDRVGKKRAGRLLDGRTWDEVPE